MPRVNKHRTGQTGDARWASWLGAVSLVSGYALNEGYTRKFGFASGSDAALLLS